MVIILTMSFLEESSQNLRKKQINIHSLTKVLGDNRFRTFVYIVLFVIYINSTLKSYIYF